MGPNCQILTGGGLGLVVKRGYEGGQEECQNEARQQLAASNHDEGWPATEQTDVGYFLTRTRNLEQRQKWFRQEKDLKYHLHFMQIPRTKRKASPLLQMSFFLPDMTWV